MKRHSTKQIARSTGATDGVVATLVIGATLALGFASAAKAVIPDNDDRSAATIVTIGYTETIDTTEATTASDDQSECGQPGQSVWYSFTPDETTYVNANTFGSDYNTTLTVYESIGLSLTYIDCDDDSGDSVQSRVRFEAQAGTSYLLMVASYPDGPPGGNLTFNLIQDIPPIPIDLALDSRGAFSSSTGIATLRGAVTCAGPTVVHVHGRLTQRFNRYFSVSGFGNTFFACDGTTPWSLEVPPFEEGRFRGGKAAAAVEAFEFADETFDDVSATVRLAGSRR